MKNLKRIFVAIAVLALTAVAGAEFAAAQQKADGLRLPSFVGDNMVLQQNADVNVWGWAKPKAKVSVTADWLPGREFAAKADKEGAWIVALPTPAASFDGHKIVVTSGKESLTVSNVLIGEVWLCSGQSNMEFKMYKTVDMKQYIDGEQNTAIRLFNTGHVYSDTEQDDVPPTKDKTPHWVVCNPTDLADFSAVGFGFGREIAETLNVPVGLVDASYGGTFAEGWTKHSVIDADAKLKADCAKIKHKTWAGKESQLYNANIYPIRHATIAGTIWYQGCANVASNPRTYDHSLGVLIDSWRDEFRNPGMPFYIVQIVPHTYVDIRGAQVRECQQRVADTKEHCEVVITNDQQEIPGDIHPRTKAQIAHRLAACALGEHYGRSAGEFRSPAFASKSVEGDAIRIRLKNVPTTIVSHGAQRINGFQIGAANPETKYVDYKVAEAEIQPDNSILVRAAGVSAPTDVRYCFNEDVGDVFSAEGLPLAPFRTDESNVSLGARPYIEAPSQIGITFTAAPGVYTKRVFGEGVHLWTNLKQVLSEEYPREFEGFEMLVARSEKNKLTPGGTFTAHGDGRIYCIARSTGDMQKLCIKTGWRIITASWLQAVTPEGKKIARQYVIYKDVKDGEQVALPQIKDHYSVFVLAKSIDLVEE